MAREIIQNSLDACRVPDAPVKVKFELLSLSHEELGFMDQMKTAVTSSLEMWSGEDRQKILQIEVLLVIHILVLKYQITIQPVFRGR